MKQDKLKKENSPQPETSIIGMAWYKKDQWDYLRQISTDVDDLEETYEEWLEQAEEEFVEMKNLGKDVRKIPIDMFELAKWRRDQNSTVNGESRAYYTAEMLRCSCENKKQ